jgi:hypothetical protein
VRADGAKEVLGLWIEQNEGAKFWLRVLNELKNRGEENILLAVVDGLKGFPEAIAAAYPETIVQTEEELPLLVEAPDPEVNYRLLTLTVTTFVNAD